MLVENQKITIKWNPMNIKHYMSKGYVFTKNGDVVTVSIKDLMKGAPVDVEFICDVCSTRFFRNWKEINRKKTSKHKCKDCLDNKKYDYKYVKNYFKKHGCVLLEDNYVSSVTPMDYICTCGEKSRITFSKFKSGQRCWNCRQDKISATQRKDFIKLKKEFETIGAKLLSSIDDYKNSHSLLWVQCHCGEKVRVTSSNYLRFKKCNICRISNLYGENNHNWNSNKTAEERFVQRNYTDYTIWRNEVFKRDNYTCQCCGDNTGGNLESHHLDGYDWCLSGRTDIKNGITLCEICHDDFHHVFGYGANTKEQFEEYMEGIAWNCSGIYKKLVI